MTKKYKPLKTDFTKESPINISKVNPELHNRINSYVNLMNENKTTDKNKKYKDSKKSDTEKRKTTVDMERGNAMANQNSSMILNELGLLRFSTLEINSLGEMQDKSISILGIKK